jgi:hypothetical protein
MFIVTLGQISGLRDVRDEHRQRVGVRDVPGRGVHSALGLAADASRTLVLEPLPLAVDEDHVGAVVVGDVEILPAVAVQVDRTHRQGPAPHDRVHRLAYILERPITTVAEQIAPATVGRVLEAVGQNARRPEIRKVPMLGIVAADVDIQIAVVIEVEPRGGIGVHPMPQAGALGDVGKRAITAIAIERGLPSR